MCFSAEVSFLSAGLLGIIGVQTLREHRKPAQLPFALLPLLFGVHQLSEGILWVYLGNQKPPDLLAYSAQFVYLLIAYFLVLLWIPIAAFLLEKVRWRRLTMGGFALLGLVLACLNFDKFEGGWVVRIVDHSIQYPNTQWIRGLPYVLTVCVPFILSSEPYLPWIGVFGALSFLIAFTFYYATSASVWCFFAACISLNIYWMLRRLNEEAGEPSDKAQSKQIHPTQ